MPTKKPFFTLCREVGEAVDVNKPVRVYRNLHRGCWSVMQGGIVRFHCSDLSLQHCRLPVSEAVRQRVVENRRKEVHAFVVGFVSHWDIYKDSLATFPKWGGLLTYNPYTHRRFELNGYPVYRVARVRFEPSGRCTALSYAHSVLNLEGSTDAA